MTLVDAIIIYVKYMLATLMCLEFVFRNVVKMLRTKGWNHMYISAENGQGIYQFLQIASFHCRK